MVEIKEDAWRIPAHWICIPTNGIVKSSGEAVMGKGLALEAAQKYWQVPHILGELLQKHGNQVHFLTTFTRDTYVPRVDGDKFYQMEEVVVSLYSFPTKHHFRDRSDLKLIEKSCQQLRKKYDTIIFQNNALPDKKPIVPKIVVPRPGCGYGGLDWETQVKPICQKYFESNDFIICYK